jgi:hypothetical protein
MQGKAVESLTAGSPGGRSTELPASPRLESPDILLGFAIILGRSILTLATRVSNRWGHVPAYGAASICSAAQTQPRVQFQRGKVPTKSWGMACPLAILLLSLFLAPEMNGESLTPDSASPAGQVTQSPRRFDDVEQTTLLDLVKNSDQIVVGEIHNVHPVRIPTNGRAISAVELTVKVQSTLWPRGVAKDKIVLTQLDQLPASLAMRSEHGSTTPVRVVLFLASPAGVLTPTVDQSAGMFLITDSGPVSEPTVTNVEDSLGIWQGFAHFAQGDAFQQAAVTELIKLPQFKSIPDRVLREKIEKWSKDFETSGRAVPLSIFQAFVRATLTATR